ncbi:hypothetical protein KC955_02555 [Candidatus Saccharibacteria bacterium]|nr:hypothetical protein [Candidatus Saccharibacteria bacterium]
MYDSDSDNANHNTPQRIKTTKIVYPQVYSYTLPDEPVNDGSQKIGYTERKDETLSAEKYFKSKFFRAVFYVSKVSQNTARDTFRSVPLQNFTPNSDIDWSKSIPEIDQQLYRKYNLSPEEIDFIESHVKAME